MEITVIGSGSTGNCYRVICDGTALLLDAGLPLDVIRRGLGFGLSDIGGCLITHSHGDHCKAAARMLGYGVDIYTSAGTASAVRYDHGTLADSPRCHIVKSLNTFCIGNLSVTPFDVRHDAPEPLGFMIAGEKERLIYFTDTSYVKYRFAGLTHIMGECNYDDELLRRSVSAGAIPQEVGARIIKDHMGFETYMEYLRANDLTRVRQIYILHISSGNGDPGKFKSEVQKLTGAEVYAC